MAKLEYDLAESLKDLRSEVNSLWPNRDKSSDGWIGDPSHQARKSDHNPDYSAGGVVRAIDIDISGIDVDKVMAVLKKDSRVNYFIYSRSIYGSSKFEKRAYKGTNPHTKHIHVSIKHTKAAEKSGSWGLKNSAPAKAPIKPSVAKRTPKGRPLLYKGVKGAGSAINRLQKDFNRVFPSYANFKGDQDFGPYMEKVVKEFQKRSGLKQDAVIGDSTWAHLIRSGINP